MIISDYDHENGVPVAFEDESIDNISTNDAFCTPQSELKRETRSSAFKTPSNTGILPAEFHGHSITKEMF